MHVASERGFDEGVSMLSQHSFMSVPAHKKTFTDTFSKDASPLSSGRSTQISAFPEPREPSFSSSSRSASVERRAVQDRLSELDQLNQRILCVLSANSALPPTATAQRANRQSRHSVPVPLNKDTALGAWLHDLRLDEVFEKLVENGFDDLEELVEQQRSGVQLTPTLLKDIGIARAGHRLILLAALELESQDTKVKSKPKRGKALSCLGPGSLPGGLITFSSVTKWLASISLEMYEFAFEKSGVDNFDQLLGLMQTSFRLTEDSLERDFGIKKLGHRHRILGSLQELARDIDAATMLFSSGAQHLTRAEQRESCELM